jgi:hypothetical protein
MSTKEWTLIHTAQSYDEAKDFAKSRLNAVNIENIHYVLLKLKLLCLITIWIM